MEIYNYAPVESCLATCLVWFLLLLQRKQKLAGQARLLINSMCSIYWRYSPNFILPKTLVQQSCQTFPSYGSPAFYYISYSRIVSNYHDSKYHHYNCSVLHKTSISYKRMPLSRQVTYTHAYIHTNLFVGDSTLYSYSSSKIKYP